MKLYRDKHGWFLGVDCNKKLDAFLHRRFGLGWCLDGQKVYNEMHRVCRICFTRNYLGYGR